MRVRQAVVVVLALLAAAGCSSSEGGEDEQLLTEQRGNYCLKLGTWQKARNARGTSTSESPTAETAAAEKAAAEDTFLATRPLREESVSGGRTLGEETVWAITDGDAKAEGRLVQYCADSGFETLTR